MSETPDIEHVLEEMRQSPIVDAELVARVAAFGAVALGRLVGVGPVRGLPRPTIYERLVQDVVATIRDTRAIPQLVELVTVARTDPSYDYFLAQEASRALSAMGVAVVPALARPEPWEHGLIEVCEVLANVGGPEAREAVARWSRRRPVTEDTRRMTRSLARLGAAEALQEALKDTDADLRAAALTDLSLLEDPRRLEWAISGLEDAVPRVRQAAAQALLAWGDERAVRPLEARLGDEDQRVRKAVKNALGRITRRKR